MKVPFQLPIYDERKNEAISSTLLVYLQIFDSSGKLPREREYFVDLLEELGVAFRGFIVFSFALGMVSLLRDILFLFPCTQFIL